MIIQSTFLKDALCDFLFSDSLVVLVLVKSSHLYLYSAFNNTNCVKATAHYRNRKIVYH